MKGPLAECGKCKWSDQVRTLQPGTSTTHFLPESCSGVSVRTWRLNRLISWSPIVIEAIKPRTCGRRSSGCVRGEVVLKRACRVGCRERTIVCELVPGRRAAQAVRVFDGVGDVRPGAKDGKAGHPYQIPQPAGFVLMRAALATFYAGRATKRPSTDPSAQTMP